MAFERGRGGAICLGALAAAGIWLGFPNDLFSFPPAALAWPLGVVLLALRSASAKQAALLGWLATFIGMEAALYWLCMPIAQVGGLVWPAAFAVALLIPACLALQGCLFAAFAFWAKGWGWPRLACALALFWYLLEFGFALVAGFPWLPLSGAFAPWPLLIQAACVFGAYCMGALWLLAALLCSAPLASGSRRARICCPIAGAALLGALIWQGAARLSSAAEEPGEAADCLMVEGNIDQNQKWTRPFQRKSLDAYIRLTSAGLAAARELGIRQPLIIWPETALPFFYERDVILGGEVREAVAGWGCPLLFGAPGIERGDDGDRVYNRAFLLAPSGATLGVYDKVHLVPFGEKLPEWLRLPFLKALLQGVGVYSEGSSNKSLDYGKLALGALICYEGIFPWLAEDRVAGGANVLVDISNDGWFGLTPAARQHLCLTALRCVEQNRWLWRATNTGISAAIDNMGRIVERGPVYEEGSLLCSGRLISGKSQFYYLSGWLPWLALGALLILAAWRDPRLRRR